MATDFKLPDLGENIESGDVLNVLVAEGDVIEPEQNVVEIETDKATVEVPCPVGGRVTKIHVQPGDTIEVGGVILSVDESGGGGSGSAAPAEKTSGAAAGSSGQSNKPAGKPAATKSESKRGGSQASNGRKAAFGEDETRDDDDAGDEPAPARRAPVEAKRPAAPRADGHKREDEHEEPAPRAVSRPTGPARPAVPALEGQDDPQADLVPHAAASPMIRRFARELGVDLNHVTGTGPGGRIQREDVVAAVRQAHAAPTAAAVPARPKPRPKPPGGVEDEDKFGAIRRERLTKIRKTIATNMARSSETIPHVTNFDDADITELDQIRRESIADYVGANLKLTMMPFVMKAVAHALKLHPMLNAMLDLENEEIVYKQYVNLGVAVDTDRGLVVPVVRNIELMGIPQLAQALGKVSEKARTNTFTLDDLRGGTFTISNLGAVGGTYSTPIINWPEVAVLLLGRSRKLPVVVDDEVKIRLMMPLSISYDHRLIDGATAARFLNEVISFLQNPGRLLLAPVVG
ncbi:MAG: 2-oxo acid dehydrogenase subunit E2 [Pirellulales bacterium]|nr:2-oxo acid dehydrogenase subunit E2 [Pirellulales bacterium]